MNTKDFIQVLRKLIREEVRAAVRQEVKSLVVETKQQPTKKYNNVLEEILAETVLPPSFRDDPAVSMDGDFSTPSQHYQADDTMKYVKNYSAVLQKAEKLSNGR